MERQRRAFSKAIMAAAVVAATIVVAGSYWAYNSVPQKNPACMDQGISSPCNSGDIVNGPIAINASQYSFYQFNIPYGAQDVAVHVRWSSTGAIAVYVMNATELIGWQNGNGLRTFYNTGQAQQGDLNLRVPPDDLYYLVFDNTLSLGCQECSSDFGVQFHVQTLLRRSTDSTDELECSGLHRCERKRNMLGGSFEPQQCGRFPNRDLHRVLERC